MQTRVFNVNGKQMCFSFQAFNIIFEKYRRNHSMKVADLEDSIANTLGVSWDTVHNWHCKKNGPIDVEKVKQIASVLEIQDFTLLLSEFDGRNNMAQLTDRQMVSAKKIYDTCLEFLDEFTNTDGFHKYWLEFKGKGSDHPEEDANGKVDGMLRKIFLVYDQEYFDLHGHPIYDEFGEFLSDGLYETYDGKLSCANSFEAVPDGNPTTMEDYDKAMIRLNSIIDKYIKG